ncbi:hypothetical protein D5018_11030 [Parashewanella curva]|uniref:Uncharacterized protein n=1 Tax=Parashewanella curva TaxID=2338552 RepID=A0A3L8PYU9_9GAMM|nr:hypothetical protein [Parashewanella curva]RLV59678.1 hypothetical protein D5018_11030 [Parashewanella curva]
MIKYNAYLSVPESTRNKIDKVLAEASSKEGRWALDVFTVKARWFTHSYAVAIWDFKATYVIRGKIGENSPDVSVNQHTTANALMQFINERIKFREQQAKEALGSGWINIHSCNYRVKNGHLVAELDDFTQSVK